MSASAINVDLPTIVLVPGFMTDSDLWTDLIPELGGCNIVCADTSTGSSLEAIAAHILGECPPSFSVLGFSLGGYVARHMTYLAGERVESLIQVATSARATSPKSRIPSGDPQDFKGLSTAAIRASLGPTRAGDAALVARIQRMGQRLGPDVYGRLSSLDRPSDQARLDEIRCECLVVSAAQDKLRSKEEAQELATGLRADLVEIPDSGHMIPLERPAELGEVVLQWLRKRTALRVPRRPTLR
jgi:pimeloyl-ACP methyl ester carboxylesterase